MRTTRFLMAVSGALLLSSCSFIEDEIGVDYVGTLDSEVHACAAIAMSGALRDDESIPSSVWARNIETLRTGDLADTTMLSYTITGEAHVVVRELEVYRWTCLLEKNTVDRTLGASILVFEQIEP